MYDLRHLFWVLTIQLYKIPVFILQLSKNPLETARSFHTGNHFFVSLIPSAVPKMLKFSWGWLQG
jgi:hypothetical protein